MGGVLYESDKMELTPDKDFVWGKLVVQGVCLRVPERWGEGGPTAAWWACGRRRRAGLAPPSQGEAVTLSSVATGWRGQRWGHLLGPAAVV